MNANNPSAPYNAGCRLGKARSVIASSIVNSAVLYIGIGLIVTPRISISQQPSVRQSTDMEMDLWRVLRSAGARQTAAAMCQRRLQAASPGSEAAAMWTIRLTAVNTDAALASDSAELWQTAAAPCREFLMSYPASDRMIWVKYQMALVELAASRDAVLTLLATVAPENSRPAVLRLVRQSVDSLSNVVTEIELNERMPSVTAEELRGLNADARLSLAEAMLLRHRCYPAKSDDALAAAVEAERIAVELLQVWPAPTEKGGQATRLRVLARLAIEDLMGASELSKQLANTRDPESVAAIARVLIAQGQYNQATSLLEESPAANGELELTRLELLFKQDPQASAITQRLAGIEARFGRYWRRRAELEILNRLPTTQATPELDETRAMQFLAASKYNEAAEMLLSAAKVSRLRGESGDATRLMFRAGAVLLKAGRTLEGIESLRTAAVADRKNSQAASMHLQACWLVGKQSTAEPMQFTDLLGEHLRLWPDDTTSNQAAEWLIAYGRDLYRPDLVVAELLKIPSSSNRYEKTIEIAGRLAIEQLREQWSNDPLGCERTAVKLARDFEISGESAKKYAGWIRILFDVAVGNDAPDNESSVGTLPLFSCLYQLRKGSSAATTDLANAITDLPKDQQPWLTDAARRLVRDGRNMSTPPSADFGKGVLILLDNGPDFGDANWLKAHAKSWTNDWNAAFGIAEGLEADGRWAAESIGIYWASMNSREAQQTALRLWDAIASGSQLGSPSWLSARYATARLLIAMGRGKEAQQVIGYVLATVSEEQTKPFLELKPQK